MIGVRHPNTDERILITLCELEQECRDCHMSLKGHWAFSIVGKTTWRCLGHLERVLVEAPAQSTSYRPQSVRIWHTVLYGSPHTNPMGLLHEACAKAEGQGMMLLTIVQAPGWDLVATFVGAESVIGGTE